jgi:hypothetical protein
VLAVKAAADANKANHRPETAAGSDTASRIYAELASALGIGAPEVSAGGSGAIGGRAGGLVSGRPGSTGLGGPLLLAGGVIAAGIVVWFVARR